MKEDGLDVHEGRVWVLKWCTQRTGAKGTGVSRKQQDEGTAVMGTQRKLFIRKTA